MDLTEAEEIKKTWQKYTEELYKKDLHASHPVIGAFIFPVTQISKGGSEVRQLVRSHKTGRLGCREMGNGLIPNRVLSPATKAIP